MSNVWTDFVKSITSNIQSADVNKVVAKLIDSIDENRDVIHNTVNILGGKKLLDPELAQLEKDFSANVKLSGERFKGGLIDAIQFNHTKVREVSGTLKKLVQNNLSDDNYNTQLTYGRANLLRLVELLDFSVDYTLRLLHWIVSSQSVLEEDKNAESPLTMGDRALLMYSATQWTQVFVAILRIDGGPGLEKLLLSIPEIEIDRDWAGEASGSANSKDPLRLGLIGGVKYNLLYWAQKYWAEWSVSRHQANQARKKVLELRLYHLKNQYDGKPDPEIQIRIGKLEKQLSILDYEVRKFEESLNG